MRGDDGMSALAVTSVESTGINCADGGLKIEVGLDDNNDGSLQASEVDQTQYVCDGADGANGTAGVNGTNGSASQNTMLTSISGPWPGVCTSGGRIVEQGLDNGDGGGTAQNGVLESGEVDYTTTYCSNFVVTRIADINSGSGRGYANHITVMGTRLYFEATDGSSGMELWAHETTNASTWQVADINSGGGSGFANEITVMGTRLYFEATNGSSGMELWAHETTNASTWQVADINSGSGSGYANGITVMGTRLYFEATDGGSGYELWAHETTNASTWQVADINSGGFGYANHITVMGTRLYFEATDGSNGYELWVHDPADGSTWRVSNFCHPSAFQGCSWGTYMTNMVAVGNRLYFDADDPLHANELHVVEIEHTITYN